MKKLIKKILKESEFDWIVETSYTEEEEFIRVKRNHITMVFLIKRVMNGISTRMMKGESFTLIMTMFMKF